MVVPVRRVGLSPLKGSVRSAERGEGSVEKGELTRWVTATRRARKRIGLLRGRLVPCWERKVSMPDGTFTLENPRRTMIPPQMRKRAHAATDACTGQLPHSLHAATGYVRLTELCSSALEVTLLQVVQAPVQQEGVEDQWNPFASEEERRNQAPQFKFLGNLRGDEDHRVD
jgi:hypothetical protein